MAKARLNTGDVLDGFSIGRIEDKVGQVLSQNAELILDDCRLPGDNLLGELHRRAGRRSAAESAYRRALQLNSNYAAAREALACLVEA